MSDIETTTVSEEGYASTSQVGGFELSIDATNEKGPDPNQVLVADYASCYLPAFRVGADQEGYDELGRVQIDADADLDADDDLEAIRFEVFVEAEVPPEDLANIVANGEEICHVHSALREGLHAEIEAFSGSF